MKEQERHEKYNDKIQKRNWTDKEYQLEIQRKRMILDEKRNKNKRRRKSPQQSPSLKTKQHPLRIKSKSQKQQPKLPECGMSPTPGDVPPSKEI